MTSINPNHAAEHNLVQGQAVEYVRTAFVDCQSRFARGICDRPKLFHGFWRVYTMVWD